MPASPVGMQLRLNELLLEQARLGKRVVVVIDEAQNLDDSVLELVRMLSNFETSREKLLHIVLSGQPQLAEKIASPELVQLRQRISMFACLDPFSPEATELYIDHRLRAAGYGFETPLFTREAIALIAQYSEGIPRNINNLCFNSLSLGCALKRKTVDGDVVREVVGDLDLDRWRKVIALAARPQEKVLELAPPVPFPASRAPRFAVWTSKIAVAAAGVFVLGGALFAGYRWLIPKHLTQTDRTGSRLAVAGRPSSGANQTPRRIAPAEAALQGNLSVPPIAAKASPPPSENETPQPAPVATTMLVTPGRTLLGICVEKFGKCNPELLHEIQRLNPGLSDPNHIEPGEKILVPGSASAQIIKEKPAEASLGSGEMQ
jgi:hypothetical protein